MESNKLINIKSEEIDQFNLGYLKRFSMYYEMLTIEPRIWNREHHFYKLTSISFAINTTLICLYKCYYSYYSPALGFFDSLLKYQRMKALIAFAFGLDLLVYKFNSQYLHKMIYDNFYSDVPNKEYYEMYEEIMRKSRLKNDF